MLVDIPVAALFTVADTTKRMSFSMTAKVCKAVALAYGKDAVASI